MGGGIGAGVSMGGAGISTGTGSTYLCAGGGTNGLGGNGVDLTN